MEQKGLTFMFVQQVAERGCLEEARAQTREPTDRNRMETALLR